MSTTETVQSCRSETGITVGLVDAVIVILRVLAPRDLGADDVQEALADLCEDPDLRTVLGARRMSDADTLREQHVAAALAAHQEWLRPGSDSGETPLHEAITNAVLAVRDREMEQLAAGRATWKAKAEEMERDRDRLAAELDALRATGDPS